MRIRTVLKKQLILDTHSLGSHPLCEKHAREDLDFMKNDSYVDWEIL